MRAQGSFDQFMLRPSGRLGLALLLAAGFTVPVKEGFAQSPATQAATRPAASTVVATTPVRKAKSKAKKSEPAAEVPQTPPPPPTLEQQPPTPPQVAYQNGQLTIDSQNATLSQVLHSVQSQTGASIDMPAGAGTERVVARLGPGKPKDVLASLLNGSKFNYVILGEANDSNGVQKVILMAKSTSSEASVAAAQNSFHPPPQPQAIEPPDDEYPQNEPEPEPEVQLAPGQPGSEGLTPDVPNSGANDIPVGGRTPEQMLQELQRMQQQQQQLQQQQQQNNPGSQQGPFPSQPLQAQPQ
jgi:hypothetical protein